MEKSIISDRIKERRAKLGFSQAEFARVSGYHRSTINAWEVGRNKPEEDAMVRVASLLECSISYLYGEADDPRPAREWHRWCEAFGSVSVDAITQQAVESFRVALQRDCLLSRSSCNKYLGYLRRCYTMAIGDGFHFRFTASSKDKGDPS